MNQTKFEKYARSYTLIEKRYLQRQNSKFSMKQLLDNTLNFLEYQFLPHYAATPPLWRLLLRKFNRDRPLPDFAVVGPIKSGSSDLVTHLLTHPCVIPPLAKEIYIPEPEYWRPYYPTSRQRKKIESRHGMAISGYLTPFMHSLQLMERLKACCSQCKVIILLRNPVQRAYSHWKWELLLGGRYAQNVSFFNEFSHYVKVALDLYPENQMDSFCGFPFLESGIYVKSVRRWLEYFGGDQVLVMDMDTYFKDRNEVLNRIQKFLEIPVLQLTGDNKPLNPNPLRLKTMDETTRDILKEFYQPYNTQLYETLGRHFSW